MKTTEKLEYLGPYQTVRKNLLKVERALSRVLLRPAALPPQFQCDLHLWLLGHEFDLSLPNYWHRSPDTGNCWPMIYGPAMHVTGEQAVGDVKLIWELNRHQFLPELARTDPKLAILLLRDWVRQNPCEFGVNWNSALEVGLRLIAWLETFEVLPHLRNEFQSNLDQHARFVRHHLSSDWIPRGNHLIGEAAALSLYEGKPHCWLRQAAAEQFYPDGVHHEQSVAYHHFVTHLMQIGGLPQPQALAYLAAIRQPDGTLPFVGDNDDGRASSGRLKLPSAPAGSIAFASAGHYVLRQGADYCFVRCGEYGLAPNYSHSHADQLSPVLWLRGQPVVIDAGTFTYNGDPEMRRYFRSAQAHNVLTINGADMAEQTGTFSWRNPPRAVCEKSRDDEIAGSVGPWRRTIRCEPRRFVITDHAPSGKLCWRFHLHPDLKMSRCGEGAFHFGNFQLTSPGTLRVGQGWFSPAYGVRRPIDVCEISMDVASPVTAEFILQ